LEDEEEDWNGIVDQMIFKIPKELRALLKFISCKEVENTKNLWHSPGNLWVGEDNILSFLKTTFHQPHEKSRELLKKLQRSSLLDIKEQSALPFWRIRSDLLAFKLSDRYYSSR
jgi:hypothetical protein